MDIPETCPETYVTLVKKCWAQKPEERPREFLFFFPFFHLSHTSQTTAFSEVVLMVDAIYVPLAKEKQ